MSYLLRFPGILGLNTWSLWEKDFRLLALLPRLELQMPELKGVSVLLKGTVAEGVFFFLDTGAWSLAFPLTNLWPKNPWIIWITSGVFFWQKAALLANVRENYCDRPSGSFYVSAREPSSSSAYKADLRYYGKSNKYRWNWRYVAGLLWPNIVFGSLRYF